MLSDDEDDIEAGLTAESFQPRETLSWFDQLAIGQDRHKKEPSKDQIGKAKCMATIMAFISAVMGFCAAAALACVPETEEAPENVYFCAGFWVLFFLMYFSGYTHLLRQSDPDEGGHCDKLVCILLLPLVNKAATAFTQTLGRDQVVGARCLGRVAGGRGSRGGYRPVFPEKVQAGAMNPG
uniref:Uncharacterized protein n=1 Tax=Leersia perrieri TaxID=77586 RepID=A0A0D9VQ81_9ORYZ